MDLPRVLVGDSTRGERIRATTARRLSLSYLPSGTDPRYDHEQASRHALARVEVKHAARDLGEVSEVSPTGRRSVAHERGAGHDLLRMRSLRSRLEDRQDAEFAQDAVTGGR